MNAAIMPSEFHPHDLYPMPIYQFYMLKDYLHLSIPNHSPPTNPSLFSRPFLLLHSLTPLSTSKALTPFSTKYITTPKLSTFRFRNSSSKNSISSYAIPLAFCSFPKCNFLSPGKICTCWKKSSARFEVCEEDDVLEVLGCGSRSWSCLRSVLARSGADDREARARMGGLGRALRERRTGGTEG